MDFSSLGHSKKITITYKFFHMLALETVVSSCTNLDYIKKPEETRRN